MRRNVDERHLIKQSVDVMHVTEMLVEQMKMKVSGDCFYPTLPNLSMEQHLF